MKKLSYILFFALLFTGLSNTINAQGGSCATSELLCNPNTSFGLAVGGSSVPETDCFGAGQTGPNWYTFAVATAGDIIVDIDATPDVDVDFGLWGPFSTPDGNCGDLDANRADCSFDSGVASETFTITNGQIGEFYMLMITNFNNEVGVSVALAQTNSAVAGAGALGGPLAFDPVPIIGVFDTDPAINLETIPPSSDPNVVINSWSGPGVTDMVNGVFDPAVAGPGTHTLTVDGTSYSCPVTRTTDISVRSCPTIDFTTPTAVCSGDPINWTPGINCSITGTVGNGQVADLFIYSTDGTLAGADMAPFGYESSIDLTPPTHSVPAPTIIDRNPNLFTVNFDHNCTSNPPTHTGFINNSGAPFTITYFLVVFDYTLDVDNNGAAEYPPSCSLARYDVIIYPDPSSVAIVIIGDDNATCAPMVEIQDAGGNTTAGPLAVLCGSTYDFSASMPWISSAETAGCGPYTVSGTITGCTDADQDGACDLAAGGADCDDTNFFIQTYGTPGAACDDGDPCTETDIYDTNGCVCAGTATATFMAMDFQEQDGTCTGPPQITLPPGYSCVYTYVLGTGANLAGCSEATAQTGVVQATCTLPLDANLNDGTVDFLITDPCGNTTIVTTNYACFSCNANHGTWDAAVISN